MARTIPPPIKFRRCRVASVAFVFWVWLSFSACHLLAAQMPADARSAVRALAWSTDSTGPRRFLCVHGRRAAVFGYPQSNAQDNSSGGLEVWAYPVQILHSYAVSFRQQNATTSIDGEAVLRRITYSPEAVTRIYAGPDFVIHEKIFVPLDETGAVISYEVESARPVEIDVRFIPSLDLMWPAAIGGQETVWNEKAAAYLLSELTHRFTASIGSPDIIAHDETPNIGQPVARLPGLAFTIRAGGDRKQARVIIAGSGPGQDVSAEVRKLLDTGDSLEAAAVAHYSELLGHVLQVETPDAEINRSLAWAEIALDQAWVCNPDLGCGIVAGYGPSRKARRPQYDWYFAGDGLVAAQALIAAGEYDRAREELEFILKRQDRKTGMIWHELSQSAAFLDWDRYPYMFVHVDLTFDFLNATGNYFSATGDREFVKAHWAEIELAYEYCRSLIDAHDGLPRIPRDKEGGREQDALTDELALSVSWAEASRAFSELANAVGHTSEADESAGASQKAVAAIGKRYWDERQQFPISGYTRSGVPLADRGMGPVSVGGKPLFSAAQLDPLLGKLASSDFQSDWGTRGNSSSAGNYDPDSYSKGSVWATGTAGAAAEFWAAHRPAVALPIWNSLVPWSSLDSLGHMHEVMAGNVYHEELESVPEQTWSSATFFSAAVNGLLGLRIDGPARRLLFAPHLPADWGEVTVRNVHVGASEIDIKMTQSIDQVTLQMQNPGAPTAITFEPEIPLGATLGPVRLGNRPVAATLEPHSQDTHARVEFDLPSGSSLLTMNYSGGVALIPDGPQVMIGERSKAIKFTSTTLKDYLYTVDFDDLPSAPSSFEMRTPWAIQNVQGATIEKRTPNVYRLVVDLPLSHGQADSYRHGKIIVKFARP